MQSGSLCLPQLGQAIAVSLCMANMGSTAMQAGKVYRWQIIEAAIMKWVHLGFDKPGCVMGIVSRDANYLNSIPRLTKDVVVVAANRYIANMPLICSRSRCIIV